MSFFNRYFIFLLLTSAIFSTVVKTNKERNHSKECTPIEECKVCSFDELKTIDECQSTGYKKKIRCHYMSNQIKMFYEPCNENTRINPVYIFLIICIIIFICSYKYQKTQKDSTLKNLMVKLSILKN